MLESRSVLPSLEIGEDDRPQVDDSVKAKSWQTNAVLFIFQVLVISLFHLTIPRDWGMYEIYLNCCGTYSMHKNGILFSWIYYEMQWKWFSFLMMLINSLIEDSRLPVEVKRFPTRSSKWIFKSMAIRWNGFLITTHNIFLNVRVPRFAFCLEKAGLIAGL